MHIFSYLFISFLPSLSISLYLHNRYGGVAQRMRRHVNMSLEPHDNLLLARRDREELDNACANLVRNETLVEKILGELLEKYLPSSSEISSSSSSSYGGQMESEVKREREQRKKNLAMECQRYQLRWGYGDSKEWDYDYGYVLIQALAKMKCLELTGTFVMN